MKEQLVVFQFSSSLTTPTWMLLLYLTDQHEWQTLGWHMYTRGHRRLSKNKHNQIELESLEERPRDCNSVEERKSPLFCLLLLRIESS